MRLEAEGRLAASGEFIAADLAGMEAEEALRISQHLEDNNKDDDEDDDEFLAEDDTMPDAEAGMESFERTEDVSLPRYRETEPPLSPSPPIFSASNDELRREYLELRVPDLPLF